MDCIFCKIANGDIPSNKVYEDEKILAFHDINPQTPVHVIIIPKAHITCADDIDDTNCDVIAHIFSKIPVIAKELGLDGYRIINNCKENGGQTVMHLLGGKKLGEKIA